MDKVTTPWSCAWTSPSFSVTLAPPQPALPAPSLASSARRLWSLQPSPVARISSPLPHVLLQLPAMDPATSAPSRASPSFLPSSASTLSCGHSSTYETSLKNRLRKLKSEADDGLRVFLSYFTEDLSLPAGTVIDFHWQPGGRFHTKVGDQFMGTILSLNFCRAFFDLYIGEPAVCNRAKQDIGLKLGQMFRDSS